MPSKHLEGLAVALGISIGIWIIVLWIARMVLHGW